jgi:DNA-binding transcriptional ArsR family regulator
MLDVCSDPTRRAILVALRHEPRCVGDIAAGLPVTRSAVSQHLKILAQAGLVRSTAQGNRRLYRVDPSGLSELRAWFDQFWDDALAAFSDHVDKEVQ